VALPALERGLRRLRTDDVADAKNSVGEKGFGLGIGMEVSRYSFSSHVLDGGVPGGG